MSNKDPSDTSTWYYDELGMYFIFTMLFNVNDIIINIYTRIIS